MDVLAWVFLGLIAGGGTLITLTTSDDQVGIISGLIGALTWLLFAYFALSITTYDSSGTMHVDRYPAMAAWGLMMAAPNLYVALTGPLELVTDRDQFRQEVR